ncbi:hypothetical protein PVAND_000331 [Polypedilum vanderplanki]|uniref:Peptidase metallopeptidase domain-containing protein n=1 Tax=Polypedilum vanderplanki TaxID=319348 RepID=A0A9J6BJR9_POLVA|nr:hypothetical protein PVAND_000331 [Polypedilum vanderplanki]
MNLFVNFIILILSSQFYSLPIKSKHKTENLNSSFDILNKSTINYHCGTPDQFSLTRFKRFIIISKWHKNHLTWRFDKYRNENRKFLSESGKIRKRIYEAVNAWAYHSNLIFEEKSANDIDVDIEIVFVPEHHEHLDVYKFNDNELAHAFYPHQTNKGDVHLNEEIEWDFNLRAGEKAKGTKVNFYAVILHELGHSLGLYHSNVTDSTMYAGYTDDTSILKEDDIKGEHLKYFLITPNQSFFIFQAIQANYGIPKKYKTTTIKTTTTREIYVRRPTSTKIPLINKPNKCHTSYDAVMTFNGELFIFKGQYMFRPVHSVTTEIRRMWEKLPENLTHIDAAFQLKNSKVLFFIDQRVFIFSQRNLEREIKLSQLGISSEVSKIDAIFRMHHNQENYIMSGDKYWKFDEEKLKIELGYPKSIALFKGVHDIDTAITYEDKLYFFKGLYFYEFNTNDMRISNKESQLLAVKFMKCQIDTSNKNEIEEKKNKKMESYVQDVTIIEEDSQNLNTTSVNSEIHHNLLKEITRTSNFCGTRDIAIRNSRQKRYVLKTKWNKTNLTWRFNDYENKFHSDSYKIRQRIAEALQTWQNHSVLKFEEKFANDVDVDIEIQFVSKSHKKIDSFLIDDPILAHAFYPTDGHLAGDVHLRNDLNYDFEARFDRYPDNKKHSFFSIVIHELGHSLGLDHSDKTDAIMYMNYGELFSLGLDDVKAIQALYGTPRGYEFSTRKPPIRGNNELPDKCNTSYDAIMLFNEKLFIFKGKYFFRETSRGIEIVKTKDLFRQLPENLTHIDAAFQLKNSKVLFFIDQRVFIFSQRNLEREINLSQLGISSEVSKIDAIFRMHHNQETYIMSGDKYWKFDEEKLKIELSYPKSIARFKGVHDIDTAITYEDKLYFFKGLYFYEFNTNEMRMSNKKPQLSANKFMKCQIEGTKIYETDEKKYKVKHDINYEKYQIENNQNKTDNIIEVEISNSNNQTNLKISKSVICLVIFIFFMSK